MVKIILMIFLFAVIGFLGYTVFTEAKLIWSKLQNEQKSFVKKSLVWAVGGLFTLTAIVFLF